MRDPQEVRVGLLWHSARSGNLGVGALTISNMLLAQSAAQRIGLSLHFAILGTGTDMESYIPANIPYKVIDRRYLQSTDGYRRDLDTLDCILDIGGGDSFADIYGWRRFAFLWLTKAAAIAKRKPLLLSPQTIGPFTKPLYRFLAAWIMARADAVVARDPMSFDAIRHLAPSAIAIQAVDVAFALPYSQATKDSGKIRIGLNISGLLFNESRMGRNRYGLSYDYADLSRSLLRTLTSLPSCQVELICHVSSPAHPIDDDDAVADLLAGEFPNATRVASFSSPSDAKSYISGLDFLVAGRMHACIAAFSAGVPFVATAYSRKFTGLFGMLDYPAVLPRTGITAAAALNFVLQQLDEREALKAALTRGNSQVEALLGRYVDALARFFERVKSSR